MKSANDQQSFRRQQALLSWDGLTFLRWQNPFIVVWWSCSFPGFGHFLLHEYVRGFLLSGWEVGINSLAHINEATVYSFSGRFDLAKQVIVPRWVFAYVIVYLFSIWDSYIRAIAANEQYTLSRLENSRLTLYAIRPLTITFMSIKRPWAALCCSFFFPGAGQLYNNRLLLGFYGIFWWLVYLWMSHSHEAILSLLLGRLTEANRMINPQWLLFMPSVIGGAMYDAYMTAYNHNELVRIEQAQYFKERYPPFSIEPFP